MDEEGIIIKKPIELWDIVIGCLSRSTLGHNSRCIYIIFIIRKNSIIKNINHKDKDNKLDDQY